MDVQVETHQTPARERAALGWLTIVAATSMIASILAPPLVFGVFAKECVLVLSAGALLIAAARTARRVVTDRAEASRRRAASLGAVLLVVSAFVTIGIARVPGLAMWAAAGTVAMAAAHVAGRGLGGAPTRWRIGVTLLLLAVAIVAIDGLSAYGAFRDAVAEGTLTERHRSGALSTRFFRHSYLAAMVLVPLIPLGWGVLVEPGARRARVRLLVLGLIFPAMAFLVVIASRAAWLSLGAGIAVAAAATWRARSGRRTPGESIGVAILATSLLIAVGLAMTGRLGTASEHLSNRFSTLLDPSGDSFDPGRLDVWRAVSRVSIDALPWGVGAGQVAGAAQAEYIGTGYVSHAHQQFLHVLAEQGPAGLLGLALLLFVALTRAWRGVADPGVSREESACLAGAAGSLAAFGTYFLLDTPLKFPPSALLFGFVTGAVLSVGGGQGSTQRVGRARRWASWSVTAVFLVLVARECAGTILGNRAIQAQAAGDLTLAIDRADRATRIAPHLAWIRSIKAGAEAASGDFGTALTTIERQSALFPGVPSVVAMHSEIAMRAGHHADAIALRQRLRQVLPEGAESLTFGLGLALKAGGRLEEARLVFGELVGQRADGGEPAQRIALAETLIRLEREEERARALLDSALADGAATAADLTASAALLTELNESTRP